MAQVRTAIRSISYFQVLLHEPQGKKGNGETQRPNVLLSPLPPTCWPDARRVLLVRSSHVWRVHVFSRTRSLGEIWARIGPAEAGRRSAGVEDAGTKLALAGSVSKPNSQKASGVHHWSVPPATQHTLMCIAAPLRPTRVFPCRSMRRHRTISTATMSRRTKMRCRCRCETRCHVRALNMPCMGVARARTAPCVAGVRGCSEPTPCPSQVKMDAMRRMRAYSAVQSGENMLQSGIYQKEMNSILGRDSLEMTVSSHQPSRKDQIDQSQTRD